MGEQSRGNLVRRVVQMIDYMAEHRNGFYRQEMCDALEIKEDTSYQWLAAFEEAGLVWKWRRFNNDAYLWRSILIIKPHMDKIGSARVADTRMGLKGCAKASRQERLAKERGQPMF